MATTHVLFSSSKSHCMKQYMSSSLLAKTRNPNASIFLFSRCPGDYDRSQRCFNMRTQGLGDTKSKQEVRCSVLPTPGLKNTLEIVDVVPSNINPGDYRLSTKNLMFFLLFLGPTAYEANIHVLPFHLRESVRSMDNGFFRSLHLKYSTSQEIVSVGFDDCATWDLENPRASQHVLLLRLARWTKNQHLRFP